MKLKTYLEKNGITLAQFASRMKVGTQTVWAWVTNGKYHKTPNATNMRKIYKLTRGKVGPNDFMDL